MIFVTQGEITRAYLEGWDVLVLERRRRYAFYVGCVLLGLPMLYIVKSMLGINLFEFHLSDLLGL